ncbi:hypothetical protein OCU04_008607 [Sclerotinia nivalis]|uniref:Flavin-nucleotide-binding protein n=1 Tax=Sclerotinia nivalis TaxID=352851 RepID=A0A9X0AJA7_9HELO|nr:hypothetical protein OCU04_008607 [Sclerotinia nivalis]
MSDSEISTYPKTPRNTVQRYRNLAKYDHQTIHGIINSSPFLHVSFNTPSPNDPFPALLPMIGFAGTYNPQNPDEEDVGEGANVYIHGYVSSRLMRMGKNPGEGEGEDDGEEKGLPMTVAASCLDGLVLALAPYNHSELVALLHFLSCIFISLLILGLFFSSLEGLGFLSIIFDHIQRFPKGKLG